MERYVPRNWQSCGFSRINEIRVWHIYARNSTNTHRIAIWIRRIESWDNRLSIGIFILANKSYRVELQRITLGDSKVGPTPGPTWTQDLVQLKPAWVKKSLDGLRHQRMLEQSEQSEWRLDVFWWYYSPGPPVGPTSGTNPGPSHIQGCNFTNTCQIAIVCWQIERKHQALSICIFTLVNKRFLVILEFGSSCWTYFWTRTRTHVRTGPIDSCFVTDCSQRLSSIYPCNQNENWTYFGGTTTHSVRRPKPGPALGPSRT